MVLRQRDHQKGLIMVTKDELFAVVRETSRIAGDAGIVEWMKARQGISEKTKETYERLGARRFRIGQDDPEQLMAGVSARSWHTTRTAVLHQLGMVFARSRRACDQAQRDGDLKAAATSADVARRAVLAFVSVQAAERPPLEGSRKTKRKSLPKSDDWQARVYEAATPAQRSGVAVLWAVGCRPVEIEKGVDVIRRVRSDGRVIIEVVIPGAKLTEKSGQPVRRFSIDPESPPGRALLEVLGDQDRMTVQRGAKRLNKDVAGIREKIGLRVSPYSLRHQASANLKAQYGQDGAEKVAEAMGHAVTRSQGRYGSVRQAQAGGSGVLVVKGSRPVKETRSKGTKPGFRGRPVPEPS